VDSTTIMVVVKSSIPCAKPMDISVADGIANATMAFVSNLDSIHTVGTPNHTFNIVPLISRCFALSRAIDFVAIASIVCRGTHLVNQMETAFRVALLSPNCRLLTLVGNAKETGTTDPFLAIVSRSGHCQQQITAATTTTKLPLVVDR